MQEPFNWLNAPAQWQQLGRGLSVITDDQTDFWRKTEYGFIRDNGHFAYHTAVGDFTAETTFVGRYETLFDQAGLMIRLDAERWIKSGIEFVDDTMNFSTVVTQDTSDWSMIPLPQAVRSEAVSVRLARKGPTVTTSYRRPDGHWQVARVAAFADQRHCQVGVMCCSPQRAGFEAQFLELTAIPTLSG
jgi:regulation of enolase protein 1 (concanavalin A-like superfamily)